MSVQIIGDSQINQLAIATAAVIVDDTEETEGGDVAIVGNHEECVADVIAIVGNHEECVADVIVEEIEEMRQSNLCCGCCCDVRG